MESQVPALVRPEVTAFWILLNKIKQLSSSSGFLVDSGLRLVGERIESNKDLRTKTLKMVGERMVEITRWILIKWKRREKPRGLRDQVAGRRAHRPHKP